MYSRVLTKGLFIFTALYIIAVYGSISADFKLPVIGIQWITLASIIVLITAFACLFGSVFTIAMICEADQDCKNAKVKIYELLNDKVISPAWHWFYMLSTLGLFQIKHYGDAFVSLVLFTFIITFRMAHQSVVRKAQIQELNKIPRRN